VGGEAYTEFRDFMSVLKELVLEVISSSDMFKQGHICEWLQISCYDVKE
jgi:hypothetical protein